MSILRSTYTERWTDEFLPLEPVISATKNYDERNQTNFQIAAEYISLVASPMAYSQVESGATFNQAHRVRCSYECVKAGQAPFRRYFQR